MVAWILAIASSFFVHPDAQYLGYIDFRTLGILWGLMVIMQGLKKHHVFEVIGQKLLVKTKKVWQLAAVLIFLCFFSSMLITNDVALITFVPFAIMMLKESNQERLLIPVIVLQTIAANLGSMLTPIGNPQNLYIYSESGMSIPEFMGVMAPYTACAFVVLIFSLIFLPNKRMTIELVDSKEDDAKITKWAKVITYFVLFALALLVVCRIVEWFYLVVAVLAAVYIMERKVLLRADYILLLTFIGFFIFTGNIARIPEIKSVLETVTYNREVLVSILVSQVISNVPATLLLFDFVASYKELLIGVGFGGLGTLIASMASLISYKCFAKEYNDKKGKYMLSFSAIGLIFLAILVGLYLLLKTFGV